MAILSNFQGVTLIAAIETFLLGKVFPRSYAPRDVSIIRVGLSIFAVNYLLLFFYSVFIFPNFVSPLRKFPRPRVSHLSPH
jgi:hypothetical protein